MDGFTWTPTVGADIRRKTTRARVATAVIVIATVVLAVVTPGRAAIVVAVLVATLAWFGWNEARRLESTVVTGSPDGRVTIADARSSITYDSSTVSSLELRRRTAGRQGLSGSDRWTLDVIADGGATHFEFAHAGGYWNLDEEQMEDLEAILLGRVRSSAGRVDTTDGRADSALGQPSPGDMATADLAPGDAVPAGSLGMAGTPRLLGGHGATTFEWSPPAHPNAARRRTIYRIVYLGLALALAIGIAVSARDESLATILLSSLTVPLMICVIAAGFDYALGRSRRLRLTVADGVLRVDRGSSKHRTVPLEGSSVQLEQKTFTGNSGGTVTETTRWVLTVTPPNGAELVQIMPSFGVVTSHDDYTLLASELRRRT